MFENMLKFKSGIETRSAGGLKMFNIGEYVVYGSGEVCRVEDKTKRCFDGISSNEYYKLAPVEYRNSAYYVPVQTADSGKRLFAADEKAFAAAEHILHGEFAFVLGIKESEVPDFIRERLSQAQSVSE